ncbi:thiol reductant ABC exporter subunit CydC [Spiribacter vilamensis]|uniref:ATP-binding cassette subfamily C protein CydC n=1 Tax=Spiribacter vilamensis TaxID=531306 RepID=A0A4Q8D267_9GAMM|nr:thiol reductant ABC exporter subunit CydC [Spiribacter vilamensis]RZU99390.1 ATP-binding cassette subfamily C protein CydC [Spiribacter vilamensis]TVO61633.1 thiol reductant ABC exporter subunit CydC [Spiribacter vilamensis]
MNELKPYLQMLTRYRGRLMLGALLMLATSASGIGLLALSGWFITATAVTGALLAAGVAATLDVYVPGGGIRAFAVSRTAARYFERIFNHDTVLRLLRDLRGRVFTMLSHLNPAEMARLRSGELLNRLTTDIDRLDGLYLRGLSPPLVALLAIFIVGALLAIGAPWLGGIVILVLTTMAGGSLLVSWRTGQRLTRDAAESSAALRATAMDHVTGLSELTAFGSLDYHRQAVMDADEQARHRDERLAKRMAYGEAFLNSGVQLTAIGVLLVALHLVQTDQISGPVAVMMPLAVLALLEPLGVLPAAGLQLARARASAERLHYGTGTIEESGYSTEPALRTSGLPAAPRVSIDSVSLIRGAGARVLDRLSLDIRPAETVGIIGMSGCGKSSIAAMVAGQIKADSGTIRIDGTNIGDFSVDSLYADLAYLTQQTDLFSGTFAGNLRIASRDADEPTMWAALKRVELADFVASTDNGLHTWVGESGMELSAGQARRLALARLFMRNPAIVILDEPLTGLDEDTARAVSATLSEWLAERTAIVLGHGSEALPGVDRCLVLRAGGLSEAI